MKNTLIILSLFISSTVFAQDSGTFKVIKKEKEQEEGVTYEEITKLLKPSITETKGNLVIVTPQIIIEVAYEEVQASNEYSSGYALRFPRFLRIRFDKKLDDINTLKEVKQIYDEQRARN